MRKLFKSIILSAALLMGATAVAPPASAAWSPWGNYKGGTMRVYTDATTYTARAATIDYKIEKKGSKKYYYKAILYKWTDSGLIHTGQVSSGSFTNSTPLKSFSVTSARRNCGNGTYIIKYNLYAKSNWTGYVGSPTSSGFFITYNM
ncbi:hypothetical protein QRX25_10515 [Bacillus sp. L381]|uniref:hypothetical protein n=1 Tax=Bacillus TaxID=1386 RepID=UPI001BAAE16C|nr:MULTISPECIES: hypothetical protein [Bacillus]MCR9040929.1 hypothetical protein [Bacillus velezensis]QUN07986.1 hypothetical protein KEF49_10370 [Bacillus amyloliquefaciens]QYM81052.1 hypothetical protein KTJ85_10220 [Bacillus sp. 7D3]QZY10199.1 hypothetical protein K7B13_10445 [Bacillus amyloliquefaciens]QZY11109.1 hypothetical protein K7B13_15445 [Bacillus amyloliquefaciens]